MRLHVNKLMGKHDGDWFMHMTVETEYINEAWFVLQLKFLRETVIAESINDDKLGRCSVTEDIVDDIDEIIKRLHPDGQ